MNHRILVVDDSAVVRSIICTFMQNAGFTICGEAENGMTAIGKATELKPDLICLDLSMPLMNGIEAAAILKKKMPDIPIIMFTIYSESAGQSLALAAGVDLILCKPDGMGKLVDAVRALLIHYGPKPLSGDTPADGTAHQEAPKSENQNGCQ